MNFQNSIWLGISRNGLLLVAEYLHGRLHIILLNVGRLHTSGFRSEVNHEGENSSLAMSLITLQYLMIQHL